MWLDAMQDDTLEQLQSDVKEANSPIIATLSFVSFLEHRHQNRETPLAWDLILAPHLTKKYC